jgi:hypothetical protein
MTGNEFLKLCTIILQAYDPPVPSLQVRFWVV